MRATQRAQARSRSSPITSGSIAEFIETGHAYDLHPILKVYTHDTARRPPLVPSLRNARPEISQSLRGTGVAPVAFLTHIN
jgi:hypothetical protein